MSAQAFAYQLPDGSDDEPDEHGRHTKTVNVLHSAAEYARFPGCAECRHISWHQQHIDLGGLVTVYDPATGDFTSHETEHDPSACAWCAHMTRCARRHLDDLPCDDGCRPA